MVSFSRQGKRGGVKSMSVLGSFGTVAAYTVIRRIVAENTFGIGKSWVQILTLPSSPQASYFTSLKLECPHL